MTDTLQFPFPQIPDPTTGGRIIYNGKIYIGNPDTDPTNAVNQVRCFYLNEAEVEIDLSQPIATNTNGLTVNPSGDFIAVKIDTEYNKYSLAIHDRNDVEQYYIANMEEVNPEINLSEDLSQAYEFPTLDDAVASTINFPVGKILHLKERSTDNDGGASWEVVLTSSVTPNTYDVVISSAVPTLSFKLKKEAYVKVSCYGVTESSIAYAITSGDALDWEDKEYLITSSVSVTTTGSINWKSNGAVIKCTASSAIGRVFDILLNGEVNHNIKGGLTFDANNNSYIGLRIETINELSHTLVAKDLTCLNAFRSGTDFVGGSGLNIKGWFSRLDLIRPTIKNCHLGVGAGISGIVGISGALIEPKSTTPFQAVEICHVEDPHIEDVYSDDLAYVIDQDGINFRTAGDDPSIDTPWPTQFNINGGVFKNCWGRSIKSQSEASYIDNVQLIRTTGNEHNGSDIDLQVGGGTVSRIRATYEAFTPDWVVTASGARRDGKLVPYTIIKDIQVVIADGETMNAVVNLANRENTRQSWFIRDLIVRGGSIDYAVRMTGGDTSTNLVTLTDVNIDTLNEYLVWSGVSSFSDDAKCIIKRVFHAGIPVPVFRASSATSPLLSCEDVFGFLEATKVDQVGSGEVNGFARIDRIAPIDATESGLIKPFSVLLADGASAVLPTIGYNTSTGMFIASVSRSRNSQAILAYDSGAVKLLSLEGSQWDTGTTADPGTGDFRAWYEPSVGVTISNNSGTTRMFTCLIIA